MQEYDTMRITKLEKQVETLAVKQIPRITADIAIISEQIKEIKNNHLQHIYTQLQKIDKRLDEVCITIAQQKPMSTLGSDVVKYIIIGVLAAALTFIIRRNE